MFEILYDSPSGMTSLRNPNVLGLNGKNDLVLGACTNDYSCTNDHSETGMCQLCGCQVVTADTISDVDPCGVDGDCGYVCADAPSCPTDGNICVDCEDAVEEDNYYLATVLINFEGYRLDPEPTAAYGVNFVPRATEASLYDLEYPLSFNRELLDDDYDVFMDLFSGTTCFWTSGNMQTVVGGISAGEFSGKVSVEISGHKPTSASVTGYVQTFTTPPFEEIYGINYAQYVQCQQNEYKVNVKYRLKPAENGGNGLVPVGMARVILTSGLQGNFVGSGYTGKNGYINIMSSAETTTLKTARASRGGFNDGSAFVGANDDIDVVLTTNHVVGSEKMITETLKNKMITSYPPDTFNDDTLTELYVTTPVVSSDRAFRLSDYLSHEDMPNYFMDDSNVDSERTSAWTNSNFSASQSLSVGDSYASTPVSITEGYGPFSVPNFSARTKRFLHLPKVNVTVPSTTNEYNAVITLHWYLLTSSSQNIKQVSVSKHLEAGTNVIETPPMFIEYDSTKIPSAIYFGYSIEVSGEETGAKTISISISGTAGNKIEG